MTVPSPFKLLPIKYPSEDTTMTTYQKPYSKLTDERGFLSASGKEAIKPFAAELARLIAMEPNPQFLRTLSCMLHREVGDQVSDALRRLSTGGTQ